MWFDNLNDKALWKNFEAISAIPRESGNEEGVRNYLLAWAKEHNIKAVTDKVGNVVMYRNADKGYETVKPLLLQGHMDMVCVKREGSTHDFTKDPIEIVCKDGIISAKDTSLGADNGIAVASILTLFEDESLKCGPLEALFTVSEETGLTGAYGLDKDLIQSRRMINLDSEEEDIIYIGCAGGIEVDAKKAIKNEPVQKSSALYTLSVSGLLGGHSGGEIHKQRANAIKLAARILHRIDNLCLVSIAGGTKRNVIPSFCTVGFVADKDRKHTIETIVNQAVAEIKDEYKIQDPGITIDLDIDTKDVPQLAIDEKLSRKWINSIYLAPHGVYSNSLAIEGIVETSSNIAIVGINEDEELYAIASIRSSIESAKNELAYVIGAAFETSKADIVYSGSYPAWTPNPNSEFAAFVGKNYKEITGHEVELTAIHAGLECGIINTIVEGMDSISIGPNLFDVHSVNEHLEAASATRILDFLKAMLTKLK